VRLKSINPHRPSDVVHEFEPAGPEAVAKAVDAARNAVGQWRELSAASRGEALAHIADDLERRADELAKLLVREVGKPIREATAEVARAIAIHRYYAQMVLAPDGETYPAAESRAWLFARRYPVGVCALITPWNFPVAIPSWKLVPAIAYGNAALLKPAHAATAIALFLQEVAAQHLPDGVFQVVAGDSETGSHLLEHPDVAAISFTGSVEVGRIVGQRAAARGARFQCEMGGQNASVVLSDADLDRAASTVAYAAMGYAGQKCTATSRVIVEASAYEDLRDRLVAAVEELEVVDPSRESTLVGPLIEDHARSSALEALERGGGKILTGGRPLDGEGFYLAPTLVEVDDPTSLLVQEEVFAPVTAVLRAESADEAVRMANDVRFGLVAAAFTRDLDRALTLASRLDVGLVRVNAPTTGVDYHAPFGGTKASSNGPREQGLAAREFYTETKTILVNP
jgi:acyl-CoA reductase-like NAD-dependent aldehyde dehydrogenase